MASWKARSLKSKSLPLVATVILLVTCSLMFGCGDNKTPVAPPTAVPTNTAVPTDIPKPTDTPKPTDIPKPTVTPVPTTAPCATDAVCSIGQTAKYQDTWVTVNSFQDLKPGDSNKPAEGKKFVGVELTVQNIGGPGVDVDSLKQMTLQDSAGVEYKVDSAAQAQAGPSMDGTIGGGGQLRGIVGFQIPESAKGLVFYYDADLMGAGGMLRFALD